MPLDLRAVRTCDQWLPGQAYSYVCHLKNVKLYRYYRQHCRGKIVLDLGCGIGYGANIVSEVATDVVAVDTSADAIRFGAQQYHHNHKLRFECVQKTLPFEDSTFDVVITNMVLEHIPPGEMIAFLSEAKRVLKPNGIFVAATPNRKIRLLPFQKPFNLNHCKEYTSRQLKQCLNRAFEHVELLSLRTDKSRNMSLHKIRPRLIALMVKPLILLFPKSIDTLKRRVINRSRRGKTDQEGTAYLDEFDVDDYYIDDRATGDCIDLIAVCQKGKGSML